MKNFFKLKLLLFFILLLLPIFIFAQAQELKRPSYRANKNVIKTAYPKLTNGDYASMAICYNNLSSNDYFIPNNTAREFLSFDTKVAQNKLSRVSKTFCCGDGFCETGIENSSNCPADCGTGGTNCDLNPPNVYKGATYAVTVNPLAIGAYCWYNNDSKNGEVYGGLYNWYVGERKRTHSWLAYADLL
ncbi:MAG: hypothetical protein Q7U47_07785 [Paludibacter sp.]|nr:hypothetical protein [Paludibacter sp.]